MKEKLRMFFSEQDRYGVYFLEKTALFMIFVGGIFTLIITSIVSHFVDLGEFSRDRSGGFISIMRFTFACIAGQLIVLLFYVPFCRDNFILRNFFLILLNIISIFILVCSVIPGENAEPEEIVKLVKEMFSKESK
ncbi:hypothetical protein [Helicobacter canadensis]|uniref:Uncharacterized protein n=1 Tax=Helicobacter canadensis MIT 98-5491 TaxID=537970 RepID=C5ZXP9_9HELI|nr:hypothetical protein [Helicobacter canadensis]EES89917.1 hypothetical protein HCAN_1207 [Helicobacter canadensis MIT 98-5491]EFR49063.1 hypothetical protein HCMG_01236 [Helicobacter canadensis MIT 98-5491]STP02584.1 Uncharacterised protein [Helicobacter canadensis]